MKYEFIYNDSQLFDINLLCNKLTEVIISKSIDKFSYSDVIISEYVNSRVVCNAVHCYRTHFVLNYSNLNKLCKVSVSHYCNNDDLFEKIVINSTDFISLNFVGTLDELDEYLLDLLESNLLFVTRINRVNKLFSKF